MRPLSSVRIARDGLRSDERTFRQHVQVLWTLVDTGYGGSGLRAGHNPRA